MSKQIEAMKQAREALNRTEEYRKGYAFAVNAAKALDAALAEQAEPLPVKTYSGVKAWHVAPEPSQYGSPELQALIVARAMEKNEAEQPRGEATLAQPLTDEQIKDAVRGAGLSFTAPDFKVARAIEAAHGITGSKT